MKKDKSFDLELPSEVWRAIEMESLRTGMTVDKIIGHWTLEKGLPKKKVTIPTRKSPRVKRG